MSYNRREQYEEIDEPFKNLLDVLYGAVRDKTDRTIVYEVKNKVGSCDDKEHEIYKTIYSRVNPIRLNVYIPVQEQVVRGLFD